MRPTLHLLTVALCALAVPATAGAAVVDPTVPAAREGTPVVLSGAALGDWSAPANQTAKLPLMDLRECETTFDPGRAGTGIAEDGGSGATKGFVREEGCHNSYAEPDVDTRDAAGRGTPVEHLLGFRWNRRARRFTEIRFQVDEVFTRYLDNSASGFSPYSGQDQHTSYAFDREGFRWTGEDPENPCLARPVSAVATDPVAGLDDNDELAFMYRDAGLRAPADAPLPRHVEELKAVRVDDPTRAGARPRWVYIARTDGRRGPGFGADDGYVRYERDPDADLYAFSQSSYKDYGNAPVGTYCDENGEPAPQQGRRRPRDTATVTTDRYRFRYDGRWLMTDIRIAPEDDGVHGPDLVDRWKARAFAQDPGSETPCCGYEEEDTNWGGSSVLLGERSGPVRVVRETWGADSGTNVVRRETFYRDGVDQRTWLRVHVIPPLDGIYAQWDFNAGRMTRFFNPRRPEGVPVDGVNDEVFGNLDDPCNERYDRNSTSQLDQGYRSLYRSLRLCGFPYHQSVDPSDPTFSEANAGLGWSVTAGPHGSIVDRIELSRETSAGGAAQGLAAVPYYRDDACFDDGTGTNPGPKLKLRSADEPETLEDGTERRCWEGEPQVPDDDPRFFQGSIATHGVHLLFLADSDNARQTVPLNEIVVDWRMAMLPGQAGARAGERYGRGFEKPLVATVLP